MGAAKARRILLEGSANSSPRQASPSGKPPGMAGATRKATRGGKPAGSSSARTCWKQAETMEGGREGERGREPQFAPERKAPGRASRRLPGSPLRGPSPALAALTRSGTRSGNCCRRRRWSSRLPGSSSPAASKEAEKSTALRRGRAGANDDRPVGGKEAPSAGARPPSFLPSFLHRRACLEAAPPAGIATRDRRTAAGLAALVSAPRKGSPAQKPGARSHLGTSRASSQAHGNWRPRSLYGWGGVGESGGVRSSGCFINTVLRVLDRRIPAPRRESGSVGCH